MTPGPGPAARSPLINHFERCRPWLEAALAHSVGGYDIDDVRAAIETGTAQFWPTRNSAAVTTIDTFPGGLKVLQFWLAGGSLAELALTEANVLAWARTLGCGKAVIIGRAGWQRRLEGYRDAGRILVKDL
ncbi:MAG TPA: hypothetical protein VHN20_07085 [Beijerinckiaceae bacterium]|nr:hypothetical protein [Beijerinckiaceae bacterium]